jgi:16S rRNA (cytidine1402-2'-O)-methyltransferase
MDNGSGGVRLQTSFAEGRRTGTLYLVGTPIGNLEDMTFRAIRTLKEVDLIAAEDTRQTRKLLTHFDIRQKLVAYHEHNKQASGPELIRLLEAGSSIALVTDAGLPGISDPGADLAAAAVARDIPVVPVPGANAALSALIVSGLPTERFVFAGFPPRDRKGLAGWLAAWDREQATVVFYEAPHRLRRTMEAIAAKWPARRVAIARELTKRHEEIARGTAAACAARLAEHPPLGECCVVMEGAGGSGSGTAMPGMAACDGAVRDDFAARFDEADAGPSMWWAGLSLAEHVERYAAAGGDRKEAMRLAARDRGLSRREVYQALLADAGKKKPPG